MSSLPFPIVMHHVDRPNISLSEIVNIAPEEAQIPVSLTPKPNCKALTFLEDYSSGRNHFHEKRRIPITFSR